MRRSMRRGRSSAHACPVGALKNRHLHALLHHGGTRRSGRSCAGVPPLPAACRGVGMPRHGGNGRKGIHGPAGGMPRGRQASGAAGGARQAAQGQIPPFPSPPSPRQDGDRQASTMWQAAHMAPCSEPWRQQAALRGCTATFWKPAYTARDGIRCGQAEQIGAGRAALAAASGPLRPPALALQARPARRRRVRGGAAAREERPAACGPRAWHSRDKCKKEVLACA